MVPEPWKPQDSLVVGLLNAWSVSHNWHQEATRLVLASSTGVTERGMRRALGAAAAAFGCYWLAIA